MRQKKGHGGFGEKGKAEGEVKVSCGENFTANGGSQEVWREET